MHISSVESFEDGSSQWCVRSPDLPLIAARMKFDASPPKAFVMRRRLQCLGDPSAQRGPAMPQPPPNIGSDAWRLWLCHAMPWGITGSYAKYLRFYATYREGAYHICFW